MRKQPDTLKHVADAAPQLDGVERKHVAALEAHGAFARIGETVHQAQERGLAGARRADHGEEFAAGDVERYAIERARARVGIALGNGVECDRYGRLRHARA